MHSSITIITDAGDFLINRNYHIFIMIFGNMLLIPSHLIQNENNTTETTNYE